MNTLNMENTISDVENYTNIENDELRELTVIDHLNTKYILKVSKDDYEHARRDLMFATKFLAEHKRKMHVNTEVPSTSYSQTSSENRKRTVKFQKLRLMDKSTNELYILIVDQETFDRANKDLYFATRLLQNHKDAVNKQKMHSLCVPEEVSNISQKDSFNARSTSHCLQHDNNEVLNENAADDDDDDYDDDDDDRNAVGKKANSQRHLWKVAETKLFLSLYKENEEKLSSEKMTHRKFWKTIVDGLRAKGYDFNINMCINKIDTLKRSYRKTKDHNNRSGNDKKTCALYKELDDIFRKKPWVKPLSVAGSNMPLGDISNCEVAKRPRSSKSVLEESKITYLQHAMEDKDRKRESMEEYRNKKLKIMEELVKTLNKN